MERKCTLIIGLPGSGKTTLAKTLLANSEVKDSILIDDPKHFSEIANAVRAKYLIIVDPHLCISLNYLTAEMMLESLGFSVERIFFENNPKQCLINAEKRGTKNVKADIDYFSKRYFIPSSANVIPVYVDS